MKLIVVMTVDQYVDSLRKLFVKHKVPAYSESEISGFRFFNEENDLDNWFAQNQRPVSSKMLFSLVEKKKADELMSSIEEYSKACSITNPFRAFQLDIEKAI